jgi:hypothetical protein
MLFRGSKTTLGLDLEGLRGLKNTVILVVICLFIYFAVTRFRLKKSINKKLTCPKVIRCQLSGISSQGNCTEMC